MPEQLQVHKEGRLTDSTANKRQHKCEGAGSRSTKPRSDQLRHEAALPRPKKRQLDEVTEVEDCVRSPRLRSVEVDEATL